jgi:hypothetical protein
VRCPFHHSIAIIFIPAGVEWLASTSTWRSPGANADPATGVRGDRGTSQLSPKALPVPSHIHNATEQLVRKSRWNIRSKSEGEMT